MRCCESGSAGCPIDFRPETGKPDTDIKSPFGKFTCPCPGAGPRNQRENLLRRRDSGKSRLLETQSITHDCMVAEETFQQLNLPLNAQRASALRFADPMVQAIWNALLVFDLLPTGFSNLDLRNNLAGLRPARRALHARLHELSVATAPPSRRD